MENENKPFYNLDDNFKELQKENFKSVVGPPKKKPLPTTIEVIKTTKSATLTIADRYKKAWEIVYKELPEWRQKEIDNQMKSGKLSDKQWDTDFVQQVTALADSDAPLAV